MKTVHSSTFVGRVADIAAVADYEQALTIDLLDETPASTWSCLRVTADILIGADQSIVTYVSFGP